MNSLGCHDEEGQKCERVFLQKDECICQTDEGTKDPGVVAGE